MSILPNTCSELERALVNQGEQIYEVDDIRNLWDPTRCPEQMLTYLAWALSVEMWEEDWHVETKRKVILKQRQIYLMKGTSKALQDAIDSLGYRAKIVYWYDNPEIKKGTFRISVVASNLSGDKASYKNILRAIENNKRGTLHLDRFDIVQAMATDIYIGCATQARTAINCKGVLRFNILQFIKNNLHTGCATQTKTVVNCKAINRN